MASESGPSALGAGILTLATASDRGSSTSDKLTNAVRPGLTFGFPAGTIAGDTLHLYDDDVEIGSGHTLTAGELAGTPITGLFGSDLADGDHPLSFKIENAAGLGAESNVETVTVDTSLGSDLTVTVDGGDLTADQTPQFDATWSTATARQHDYFESRRNSDGLLLCTHKITLAEEGAKALSESSTVSLPYGSIDIAHSIYRYPDRGTLLARTTFDGLGAGTLNGHTCDKVDPGNNWVSDTQWVGDGSGKITTSAGGSYFAYLDVGVSDDIMRVLVEMELPDPFNNWLNIALLSDGNPFNTTGDGIVLRRNNDDLLLQEFVGGSLTNSLTGATNIFTGDEGTTVLIDFYIDASDIVVLADDVEVIRESDYSVPAGMTGNGQVSLSTTNGIAGKFDNFWVFGS